MRNLMIGLVLGALLGAATSTLVAQRSADSYPDAVTADPKHYSAVIRERRSALRPSAVRPR